jgi:hypothetical protein
MDDLGFSVNWWVILGDCSAVGGAIGAADLAARGDLVRGLALLDQLDGRSE